MSTEQAARNKAAFERLMEGLSSHDETRIAKVVDEHFSPDVRMETPLPLQATGAEAVKEVFRILLAALPDLRVHVEDLIAEGDKVVTRNTVTGTHTGGPYMGVPATGKAIEYKEIFIGRFENGRVVETWGVVDVLSQMKQLGVVQGP